MKALITGGTSGIGLELTKYLSTIGYDIIIIARNTNIKKEEFKTKVELYSYDLSEEDNCYKVYNKLSKDKIDIIINNAGFGDIGDYKKDNLDKEINMINLNIKSYHILTKLFINNKNTKHIMNVSSIAGFFPAGPLMNTYYATKNYINSYTLALYEELRRNNKEVHISLLCPGPVKTNFDNRAGIKNSNKGLSPQKVAKYSIKKMLKNKLIIIPGIKNKLAYFFIRFIPLKLLLKISYNFQNKKS